MGEEGCGIGVENRVGKTKCSVSCLVNQVLLWSRVIYVFFSGGLSEERSERSGSGFDLDLVPKPDPRSDLETRNQVRVRKWKEGGGRRKKRKKREEDERGERKERGRR